MCAGRQSLTRFRHGYGPGLMVAKRVVAVGVGQHAATAAEVGVEGADVLVLLVSVAAAGVGLPDLDQRVFQRPAELIVHVAVDDDPLADRHAALGVVEDQVVVERAELVGAKDRRGHFRERLLQRDQRQARAAQDAGLVGRRIGGRMRRGVAHQEFGVGGGGRSHVDLSWGAVRASRCVRGKQVSKDGSVALAILCSGHGWPCKGRECPDSARPMAPGGRCDPVPGAGATEVCRIGEAALPGDRRDRDAGRPRLPEQRASPVEACVLDQACGVTRLGRKML